MEMLAGVSSIRKVLNEKTGADFCQSQTSLPCHIVVDTSPRRILFSRARKHVFYVCADRRPQAKIR